MKKFIVVIRVVLLLIAALCLIAAFAIRNYTMIHFPTVLSGCVFAGLVFGLILAPHVSRLTGLSNRVLNVCLVTVVTGSIIAGLFMVGNYAFTSPETRHEEKLLVVDRYKETHYHSRRVGRNRYVRGTPYNEYYLTVEHPDGTRRPMLVRVERYRKTHPGDSVKVSFERGLFGFEVLRR